MIVIEDKGQQDKKHELKHLHFESHGIYWERYPLPCGDYIIGTDAVMDVITRKQKRGMDPKKMDFLGTYQKTVDTKKDIQEIIGNVCGKQHARFRDECILAKNNDIRLYVLIENMDGIKTIDDLETWNNPRIARWNRIKEQHAKGRWGNIPLSKRPPTSGAELAKSMRTMQEKYGVSFLFCAPEEAGAMVLELLEVSENG